MYTGSGISKETQHISPHIAAHKSSLAPTSSVSSITSVGLNSGGPYDLAHHHINKGGFNTHIPTYKVGMHQPHQSIAKGLDHDGVSSMGRHGHAAMSHHSRSAPQDLSAHAAGTDKAMPLELTPHSSIHHKPLPHIHTVVSQGVSGNQIGSLMPAHQTDRGSPYFRVPDSVINVQGPSAVLVSSGGEGVSSSSHSISHASSMVHAVSSHNVATNLTTMPPASLATTVSLPGGVASTMSNSHMMPNECSAASNVSTGCVMPHSDLRGVKKEKAEQLEGMGLAADQRQVCHPEGGPQRDLVRQALQAVVTNPQHKTGNDQEVIEYNYTAGDIAELLMMNIQVNASLQAMNKGNVPPEQEAGEVVMLQPAEVDETNSLTSSFSQSPKRRRPKLSDEAQAERRIRIALRMREKRAEESDEQKRLRRIREAERMRRKRAAEDEEQKVRRRLEAAARARNRRASMTMEERIQDRERAAERMRLRRATESPDSKTVRRLKAAERMRKRRATETPEQRNQRRQNIAVRMKARRKRKSEESINGDEPEVLNQSTNDRLVKTENTRSATHQESSEPVVNVNPNHSTPQTVTSSPHIYVPSTIGAGGGSIAVLHMDSSLPSMSLGHAPNPGLSTVDMTQLGQPLSLQKTSSANQEQKQAVATQDTPTSMSSQETSSLSSFITIPHSTLEPLSLHKASSYHHHIPHLLHYHQPHSSSVQQHPQQHLHHHHHHHSSHHHQQRHQHQ